MEAPTRQLIYVSAAVCGLIALTVLLARRNKRRETKGVPQRPRLVASPRSVGTNSVPASPRHAFFTEHTNKRYSMDKALVIVMVGFPARGKSLLVSKLIRYLKWIGYPAKHFSAETQNCMPSPRTKAKGYGGDGWRGLSVTVLNNLINWLGTNEGACVAIYDTRNVSRKQRAAVLKKIAGETIHTVTLFIESICDDPMILQSLRQTKIRQRYGSDKANFSAVDIRDRYNREMSKLLREEAEHISQYDPLDESEDDGHVMFVQVFNFGQKVQTNLCRGYLPSQIIFFLQNIHNSSRRIWLVRTGEKHNAAEGGTLGGDDALTRRGHKFSEALWHFIKAQAPAVSACGEEIVVWTGTALRAMETRQYMEEDDVPCISSPSLNDIRRGEYEGKAAMEWEADTKVVADICKAHKHLYTHPLITCLRRFLPNRIPIVSQSYPRRLRRVARTICGINGRAVRASLT
jgi:hypothetical protein